MKNVLFIAGLKEEYYYLPFVEACKGRNVVIYLFDSSRFPEQAVVSVKCDGLTMSGFVDVIKYVGNEHKDVRLPISDINIAWHLREGTNSLEKENDSIEKRFARNESRAALRSFFSILPCVWVNRKENVDRLSSNKLCQQMVAQRCGLLTPRTLISNDPASVAEFSVPDGDILLKSMGCIKLDDKGEYSLYSQRFTLNELKGVENAIRHCPIFAQEYIEKSCEHRVMVIGDRVLSCRIDSQVSEKTKTDWRHYDFENVAHTTSELPIPVQDSLKRFMSEIGLRYGAIDLIETPQGNFVFLEINPSGQWGWVADLTGLPVPEAVADMLESL